jgi:hypothetical protein
MPDLPGGQPGTDKVDAELKLQEVLKLTDSPDIRAIDTQQPGPPEIVAHKIDASHHVPMAGVHLEATAANALNFPVQRLVIGIGAQHSIVIDFFGCGNVARGRLRVRNGRLGDMMRGPSSLLSGRHIGLR